MSRPQSRPKSERPKSERPKSERPKSERPKSEPKHVFQALCDEAARACPGGDMADIERYVASRLAAMDEESRRVVAREMAQVLGFRAPECPVFEQ